MLDAGYRVCYKSSKSGKYWPNVSRENRIGLLLVELEKLLTAIKRDIAGVSLPVPRGVQFLISLKSFEDTLDALMCCWMGMMFLEGEAVPLGDSNAAIWVPKEGNAVLTKGVDRKRQTPRDPATQH